MTRSSDDAADVGAGYEPHITPSDSVSSQESEGESGVDPDDAVPTPTGPLENNAPTRDANTAEDANEPPAEPWQDAQDEEN